MRNINDGGPAFPVPMWARLADGQPMAATEYGLGGMTLRDYFAAKAMTGIVANSSMIQTLDRSWCDHIATEAYKLADAMIAERQKL